MVGYHYWETFVVDIKGKIERGELIPDPDWQRGYIWNPKDERLLIDSILKEIPIPKFYLTQEYDAEKDAVIHYVVDGQQRLKAIYRFLTNKFEVEVEGRKYYFRDLGSATQEKITLCKFSGHYMTDFEQADINFLFQRLNRTGIKLTNMEVWNNEYYKTNVMGMVREIYEEVCGFPPKRDYRDYDDSDYKRLEKSYAAGVYTQENIKRMLPLDDIIDLCNCLMKNSVESGSKKELESFLKLKIDISDREKSSLKSKFRKTLNNVKEVLSKRDLEASAFRKRTHFISLFLAIGLLIDEYYILNDITRLKKDLLEFILNQPKRYKQSILGGIRQKAMRQTRVKFFQRVVKRQAKKLDDQRLFDDSLKRTLWSKSDGMCQICKKQIQSYDRATVDHIVPWAKGGKTRATNAQIAHVRCNKRKRDKFEKFIIK